MKGPKQLNPKWPSVLETLRIRVQELEQECDTANAKLKKVEQERDRATDQYKSVIAEWARLEQAAYGAP